MRLPVKLLAGLTCAGLLWSALPLADLRADEGQEHSALHDIMEQMKDNLKRRGRSRPSSSNPTTWTRFPRISTRITSIPSAATWSAQCR